MNVSWHRGHITALRLMLETLAQRARSESSGLNVFVRDSSLLETTDRAVWAETRDKLAEVVDHLSQAERLLPRVEQELYELGERLKRSDG